MTNEVASNAAAPDATNVSAQAFGNRFTPAAIAVTKGVGKTTIVVYVAAWLGALLALRAEQSPDMMAGFMEALLTIAGALLAHLICVPLAVRNALARIEYGNVTKVTRLTVLLAIVGIPTLLVGIYVYPLVATGLCLLALRIVDQTNSRKRAVLIVLTIAVVVVPMGAVALIEG
jgi:hypothetical protein